MATQHPAMQDLNRRERDRLRKERLTLASEIGELAADFEVVAELVNPDVLALAERIREEG